MAPLIEHHGAFISLCAPRAIVDVRGIVVAVVILLGHHYHGTRLAPTALVDGIAHAAINAARATIKLDVYESLSLLSAIALGHVHVARVDILQGRSEQLPFVSLELIFHPRPFIDQFLLVSQLGLGLEVDFLAGIAIELLAVIIIFAIIIVVLVQILVYSHHQVILYVLGGIIRELVEQSVVDDALAAIAQLGQSGRLHIGGQGDLGKLHRHIGLLARQFRVVALAIVRVVILIDFLLQRACPVLVIVPVGAHHLVGRPSPGHVFGHYLQGEKRVAIACLLARGQLFLVIELEAQIISVALVEGSSTFGNTNGDDGIVSGQVLHLAYFAVGDIRPCGVVGGDHCHTAILFFHREMKILTSHHVLIAMHRKSQSLSFIPHGLQLAQSHAHCTSGVLLVSHFLETQFQLRSRCSYG